MAQPLHFLNQACVLQDNLWQLSNQNNIG